MSDLTDEEVRVLQLLDKGELSAMTVPEEMRGLLATLMERGLVWALDRRGMTFFKVSTEGGRRLGMHYETAAHHLEESQKTTSADKQDANTEKLYTAEIYLKSGSVVVLDRVVKLTVSHVGGGVTGFKLEQKLDARRRLMVQSLDLTQIEAVTSTEEDTL